MKKVMKFEAINFDKFEKFKSSAIKDTSKIKGGATDAMDLCDKRRPRPGGGSGSNCR